MLKKLTVAVLSVAFALVAVPVDAQSISEAELRAAGLSDSEVALFMSLLGGSSSSSSACPVDPNNISVGLSVGMQHSDAMAVQQLMNYFATEMGLNTRVATTGAGSPGMETSYYGPATSAAVKRFQETYRAEILTPNGLAMGTGYYGPSTSAQAQVLCADAGMDDDNDDSDDSDDEMDDDSDDDDDRLRGGESSLEDLDVSDGEDEEVSEGETGEVMTIEFDVEDGDARVSRLDLSMYTNASGSEEDEPWETFETITIYDEDGEELASEDVTDEGDWLDEDSNGSSSDPYVYRFNNLDYVVREGDKAMMTVEVEVEGSVDSASTTIGWTFFIDTDDIRAVDSEGINQYLGDSTETATFDIVEEGDDDEVQIQNSSNDPDASTIQVDSNDQSDEYAIHIFDVEVGEDSNDIEVDEVYASITVTNPSGGDASITMDDVIDEVWLEIDGERVDYDSVTSDFTTAITDTNSDTAVFTFDFDKDLVLEADNNDDVEYETQLIVRFEQVTGNYDEATTISGAVTSTDTGNWDLEGADSVTATGSATGETHTLRSEGIFATDFSSSNTVTENSNGEVASVTYTLTWDVTAFEDDAYVPNSVNRGTDTSSGVTYQVEDSGDNVAAANDAATTEAFSSSADVSGSYFIVREGETEEFTLSVTVTDDSTADVEVPGSVRIQLLEMNFNDTAAAADTQYDFTPAQDYDSALVNLQT